MSAFALLAGIIGFEWRFQTRRLTYAAAVLLVAFVPIATVITGFGPASAAINAPYIVMETAGIVTLVSVFALPMLCISAAVRDDEFRMRELVGSRPVPRGMLLGGRFIGVLAAALALMASSMVVQAVSPYVFDVRAERLVAFSPAPYLSAFGLLVIPNTLCCLALLYFVAAASRSTLATFVASIGIYAGYAVTAMMVDSPLMAGTRPPTPELLARTALLDPFGLSAFFEQTRYWTPLERNTRLVSLSGHMLWNRWLVLGLSALCLAPMAWLDRRSSQPRAMRSRRRVAMAGDDTVAPPGAGAAVPAYLAPVTPVRPSPPSLATLVSATLATLRLESKLILRSWPLRALLVLWVAMIAIEAQGQLAGGEYGTRVLASSAVLADAVPIGLWLIGTLCALYFAADVVGRERILRFDGLRDATPVADSALLLGKLGALLLIPALLGTAGYGTAMMVHATADGLPIEPRVYAAHAITSLVPLWIMTVLAVALQVLLGNRWLGLLVGLMMAFIIEDGEDVGLEHLLTRFGATPPLRWSDMDGFGSALPSWIAFNVTWTLGAVSLIAVAAAVWPRGVPSSFVARLRAAPRVWWRGASPTGRAGTAGVLGAFVVAYGLMARETIGKAHWQGNDDALAWRADYERTYRRLQQVPQPDVVDVQLDVALEPERRRAVVRGALVLENRTTRAVDTLWILPPRDAVAVQLDVDGLAGAVRDPRFGVHAVALSRPLAPGARTSVRYSLTLDRSGLRADGFEEDVAANGTFITSSTLLPALGYQGRYEIASDLERARRGLGDASEMLAPVAQYDSLAAMARARGASPAWFTVRATISTSADQTALGPGDLVREWTADGRRHFEYRLDRPSTPYFAITSARYAVERGRHHDVRIELWHHPGHAVHAVRIVQVAARSLEVLEGHFGRYPHRTLRIIEVPASSGFGAYAQTGSIYLTETRGMLADARDGDVDLLLRRIGHEVAHQWWGHAVDPLWVEGRLTIVESLAKYSEQLLLDAAQGSDVLAEMMAFDHDRYLAGRANTIGLEPTLLTSMDEAHLYYGKGALAFHALRAGLGDSVLIGALRMLVDDDGGPRGAASAVRLHTMLLARAPDEDARTLVNEWFAERVIYDLAADTASAESEGASTHVMARFRVQRIRTDSAGEHVLSADGVPVTVGIYGGTPERRQLLARVRRRVLNGSVGVDTTVSGRATLVEVDPDIRLIDRDRSNNRLVLLRR